MVHMHLQSLEVIASLAEPIKKGPFHGVSPRLGDATTIIEPFVYSNKRPFLMTQVHCISSYELLPFSDLSLTKWRGDFTDNYPVG